MLHYREHFLQLSEQGFIEIPLYMQRYMPHHLRVVIGQLRVSSHQLEIERGRARGLPRDERICPICHTEVESEEHFMVRCTAYSALRVQFGMEDTLQQCIARSDQVQLGRFLTAAWGIREQILQPRLQAGERTQRTITEFFQREVSSERSSTRTSGLTLQQAETQRARRRPRVPGYRRPRPHQSEISRIRALHQHHLEMRYASTHWTTRLQEALRPPFSMYDILHPSYIVCF
ncbi:hypothetical protein L7F22_023216 [Adiantum nelumboides]|nr:hypothetical protein [Adiantum nelumboides]